MARYDDLGDGGGTGWPLAVGTATAALTAAGAVLWRRQRSVSALLTGA